MKRFFAIVLLMVLTALGLTAWRSWAWWSWASAPVDPTDSWANAAETDRVQVEIPQGTPSQQIGQELADAGLIRSTTAWKLWTRWQTFQDDSGGYQAGTYALSPEQPLTAIAAKIWTGDVVELSFTIPEGWNREQIAALLERQGLVSSLAFLAATEQIPTANYPWLPSGLPHLEGFLYPDTYQVPEGEIDTETVIRLMLDRFEQIALPLYQASNQAQNRYSLLQWVTLASIVEREAVVAEERDEIASVFARRLQEGIPLGADPTVEYGLGIEQTPDQPLTLDQVRTPNPYNTYINAGLPPTPIANAGLASLEASLNPAPTEFLYFVARYDGTHVFSRTLTEHELAQATIRDQVELQPVE
ncbi:endolytic transglycosylase MltG [Romeria aff. gracilis LEGE 07310]|uniref:Endolytic murein transglycosylase n=1 Tax=Vasconcelosia minhoensis LEGE 07310 TaxID=915328 RepID=A0A8J7AMM4_9CYAN|nr:endolytic transglycosylase MltG [Romeria gracilis]MBE9077116.1 endolytic transglycosylase MltG [Romeria aff. gracilis LEGE 07310]